MFLFILITFSFLQTTHKSTVTLKKQREPSHQHNLTVTMKPPPFPLQRKSINESTGITNIIPSNTPSTKKTTLLNTSRKTLLNLSLNTIYKVTLKEQKKLQDADNDSGFGQGPPLPPVSDSEDDLDNTIQDKDMRDFIGAQEIFKPKYKSVLETLGRTHIQLDERTQVSSTKLSDEAITITSQVPIVIQNKQTNFGPNKILKEFVLHTKVFVESEHVTTDPFNESMYSVPLKSIVNSSDRKYIIHLGDQKIQSNAIQESCHVNKYRYNLGFCSEIYNNKNQKMNAIAFKFLSEIFVTDVAAIKNTLNNKDKNCRVLFIYDRTLAGNDTCGSAANIVACLAFGFSTIKPSEGNPLYCYADYLAVNKDYCSGSIASFILNIGQLFLKQETRENTPIQLFLNCKTQLQTLYKRYGFEICPFKELSQKKGTFKSVCKRFALDTWFNKKEMDDSKQCMQIMFTKDTVPRFVNYLKYPFVDCENNIYKNTRNEETHESNRDDNPGNEKTHESNGDDNPRNEETHESNGDDESSTAHFFSEEEKDPDTHETDNGTNVVGTNVIKSTPKEKIDKQRRSSRIMTKQLKCPNELENEFKKEIKKLVQNTFYSSIRPREEELFDKKIQQSLKVQAFVKNVLQNDNYIFQFGKVYNSAYTSYSSVRKEPTDLFPNNTSAMLKYLEISLIPDQVSLSEENSTVGSLWVKVKCSKCNKFCYVKKSHDQRMETFLLRVIYSTWTTHVFSLSIKDDNNWTICHPTWNQCSARIGHYYNELKHTMIVTSNKFPKENSDESNHNLFQQDNVKVLCCMLFDYHCKIVKALFVRAVIISYDMNSKKSQTLGARSARTYIQTQAALMTDISAKITKSAVKRRPTTKKETDNVKRQRYKKEKEWLKIFENDLALQKKFNSLMWVQPSVVNHSTLPSVSQDYIQECKSDKNLAELIKKKEVNHDFSHFVAIVALQKNYPRKYIISSDYFVSRNSVNQKTKIRRVTKLTVDTCYDSPNTTIRLSKDDKDLIKKHVQDTLAKGSIFKIKRIELKKKETIEIESVVYDGMTSESKYQYQGLDDKNGVHKLSDDWLELNFKSRFTDFYNHLLTMPVTGEYLDVPLGSRKSGNTDWPVTLKKGPSIYYRQIDGDSSCLYYSIASVFKYHHHHHVSDMLIRVYLEQSNSGHFIPQPIDIINILRNKDRKKGEGGKKLKFVIKKLMNIDIKEVLSDYSCKIYFCILTNNHAVCLFEYYIFDSSFSHALPRNEESLRVSSELESFRELSQAIKKIYTIEF